MLNSFHMNGHIMSFNQQTQNVIVLLYMPPLLTPGVEGLNDSP